ncbi:MAG: delta-60 repeat domain-containing protein [Planctomycetota bacterium]|nr:delta-60 repeat domain-containing protein [Planctomycetota bacterium]
MPRLLAGRFGILILFVIVSVIVSVIVACHDDDDDDDNPLNDDGVVVHDNAAGGMFDDRASAIAIDSMGRILVAGHSWSASFDLDLVVWRFRSDGRLDGTFAGQGWVTDDGAAGGMFDDLGHAIVVDSMDNVVVAGSSTNASFNQDLTVWRFTEAGVPDTSFGTNGSVSHDGAAGGGGDDEGRGMALDASGNIIVAGSSAGPAGDLDLAIWRFDMTGALDVTFNGQGWVTHDNAAGGMADDAAEAVLLEPTGSILAAGWSVNATGDLDMALWRFDGSGTLDSTLNAVGWLVHHDAAGGMADDFGLSIDQYGSGRIVVSGASQNSDMNHDMVVWRFNPAGGLDGTFNTQGWIVHASAAGGIGDDVGHGVVIDADGNVIVAGESQNVFTNQDRVVWRLRVDGSLDTSFHMNGFVAEDGAAGGSGDDIGRAVALNSTEAILVAGESENISGNQDAAVWKE